MRSFRKLVAFPVLIVGFGILGFDGTSRFVGQIPVLSPKVVLTADGGAPPPPPLPVPTTNVMLTADGGAPPPPPLPVPTNQATLTAVS